MNTDPLLQYQQDFLNYLLGCPDLADVPMHTFRDQIVTDVMQQGTDIWTDRSGLNKVGTAIQVREPDVFTRDTGGVPGPQLWVQIGLRIFEDRIQNNTGLTSLGIGLAILRWCEGIAIGRAGQQAVYTVPDPRGNNALKAIYDFADRYCNELYFVARWPQNWTARANDATITDNNQGLVTLAPGADDAPIYYTTDGSTPILPGTTVPKDIQNTAKLYAAPFNVAAGTLVTWVSYLPGGRPSNINRTTVTIP